jgi:hypothetical protein
MAFTYTVNDEFNAGGAKIVSGTYTSAGGSTGGDVKTGLLTVLSFVMSPKGSSVVANQGAVNETFPLSKGDVTIVTTANEVGQWIAIGI